MNSQQFLQRRLESYQKVLSIIGPSGTGKTFSAEFLQEFLGYKIAPQITTREARPDDKHYKYLSKEEFLSLEEQGKILGMFAGDKRTLEGNGYGYLIEEVLDLISTDRRIILFPSAFELQMSNFQTLYGTTDKADEIIKKVEGSTFRKIYNISIINEDSFEKPNDLLAICK